MDWFCVIWIVVLLQCVYCAPLDEKELEIILNSLSDDELREISDIVVKMQTKKSTDSEKSSLNHKRSLWKDAKELTKAMIEQENYAAKHGHASEPFKILTRFMPSTNRIAGGSLAAKTQLNAIYAYKKEWLKKRSFEPEADFWKDLKEKFGESIVDESTRDLQPIDGLNIFYDRSCDLQNFVDCTVYDDKYRTITGVCNNKAFPYFGSVDRAQPRLMKADYDDSISSPRGPQLPPSLEVSKKLLHIDAPKTSPITTLMMMQLGQFLDHDLSHTPVASVYNAITGNTDSVKCTSLEIQDCIKPEGSQCFPLKNIEPNTDCTEFVRSQEFVGTGDCKLDRRQQANTITSWLDLSQVYGSTTEELNALRDPDTTRARMDKEKNPDPTLKDMLPYATGETGCRAITEKVKCFHAGDVRQNEQIGLTAMHTLFMRMHNVVEEKLFNLVDPDQSITMKDLFQETRKIMGAIWQHMVYFEYLPVLLGDEIIETFKLKPKEKDYFKGYNTDVQGDIFNVFSTAAFRFGHSELRDIFTFVTETYDNKKDTKFNNIVFNPTKLYSSPVEFGPLAITSAIDSLVLGLISAKAGEIDGQFPSQITQHLFTESPPIGLGFDLPALNIQRGRDHGIPGYGKWRKFCQLSEDYDDIPDDIINKIEELYSNIDEVDLYPAAMNEKHVHKGRIGPTFACLIALQFKHLKLGDRFYYENAYENENEEDIKEFKEDELKEIRKFSLARLICDTIDNTDKIEIQPYVLLQPQVNLETVSQLYHGDNGKVSCAEIEQMDYDVFKTRVRKPPTK